MNYKLLFTCEHAGNTVPPEYMYLFKGEEEVLYSHKAIDLGALRLARHAAVNLDVPLYYTTYSRLLVEANRSPDDEELFSEYVKQESKKVKQDIVEKYYLPHRKNVEKKIAEFISEGHQVVHIALHTFAPVVGKDVRTTDVGILFDPDRPGEKELCGSLRKEIVKVNSALDVHFNLPYPGTEDSFPTYLRNKFAADKYLGFEIEVNQKFYLTGEPAVWEKLVDEITTALSRLRKTALVNAA